MLKSYQSLDEQRLKHTSTITTCTVYIYSAYHKLTNLFLPCWNLYLQTDSYSLMHNHLQPQSMSPQMPILLRTEHWHILLAVGSLWSWRQSCWLSAELRYCLGHFEGIPCSTLSWSSCHKQCKDHSEMQKLHLQCRWHNLDVSVKWHDDQCKHMHFVRLAGSCTC